MKNSFFFVLSLIFFSCSFYVFGSFDDYTFDGLEEVSHGDTIGTLPQNFVYNSAEHIE